MAKDQSRRDYDGAFALTANRDAVFEGRYSAYETIVLKCLAQSPRAFG